MIIDFHAHTFPPKISLKALESLSKNGHVKYTADGTVDSLIEMMSHSGVKYSVNLPVMTRADQVSQVNDSLLRTKDKLFSMGIVTFGGLHPAFEDYKQEIRRLKEAGIKGIKLHPAFQGVHINDIAYKRIIAEISAQGMIAITHSGLDVGFLNENYATVPELLDLIDDVHPEKLVLAHMGGWQAWDEVQRDLAGAPVWLDTAFSLGPVQIRPGDEDVMLYHSNMSRQNFVSLVRKHGADKVLFATDSPWERQEDYLAFIKGCDLSEKEKQLVLGENAAALLNI